MHISSVVAAKLHELYFKLLPHTQHLPKLASGDYSLFINLKKWLIGQRVASREARAETNAYFAELDKSYYTIGIKMLEKYLSKYIDIKGDYVKNREEV